MIKVKKYEKNVIQYTCDCGARGKCFLKSIDEDAALVIDIKCLACNNSERMTLVQYSSEENKKELLDDLKNNNIDLSWVPFITEEATNEYEE